MTYTIPLSQLNKNDLPLAGGKAANLGELITAGFPVPPGFVLTTSAYTVFVQAHGLQQQIVALAHTVSADDPQSSAVASAKIQQLFLAAGIPNDIADALLSAYGDLGAAAVAVRSSATAEDLPTASFAGQQDTFLNIQDEGALLEAVKKCWASLWTARAISYRLRQAINPASVSLAVVVQQLALADTAGILFTADPLNGERDHIVINATWGLGEAIVGGQVTPDTVVVDKLKWQILSRETAIKSVMTVRREQGTAEQPVPSVQQNQPAIDDATAIELARYGAKIEAHFGLAMDIEWAIADDKIAILQARPITNLPPAPLRDVRWQPPRPGTLWMRRQIVEHMPEPLSPLFDELYLQEGLDHSLESFTAFMSELSGVKINMWDFIEPPFAVTVNGYAYTIASFDFNWRLIPLILRLYLLVLPKMIRQLLPRWRNQSLPAYQANIERWQRIDLSQALDLDLLRGIRELAYEDALYWFAAAVPLGLARITDALLDSFLKAVSDGVRLTSGAFLRGFPSKTAEAQTQLEAIARKTRETDELGEAIINTPAPHLRDLLAQHPDVMADLQRYLDTYGHQIYNLDFAAPTLADDPLPVLLSLKMAVAHPERDARTHQARLAQEREALVERTEQSLNPIQRRIFKLLLGWAQRYAPNREVALFYVGAAWPTLRRLALELGQRLTEAGSLDSPDDVFYLESAELVSASAARTDGLSRPDLAKVAQERRTLREARMRLDPPLSVPPGGRMKFGPIDMAMFEPKPRVASTGPVLDGFAVSPGQVIAPASVIRSPQDFDKMSPDSILVCPTTTPAWTPLFAQAKGLVTDIGGALAHGSIVAREYGIPAVMGTGVATQRIESGQLIRVDGDKGTVTLLDQVNATTEESIQPRPITEQQAARQRKRLIMLVAGLAVILIWLWRKGRRGTN